MVKIIIFLDKYSDWLETYGVLQANYRVSYNVDLYILNNDRNDLVSIRGIYTSLLRKDSLLNIIQFDDKLELFRSFEIAAFHLKAGDFIVAPFIRYRDIWKLAGNKKLNNVITVHISECLPDTFGHINYRLAFRSRKLKTWLTLPIAKIYAMINKPDRSYFPFYPSMNNPFVKKTLSVVIPPLLGSKQLILKDLLSDEKRTLLIGGFGYDVKKMANYLKLDKYIATSKGMEIIIDGFKYPLIERICAEEVLLSGYVHNIVSYNSSAVVWAKILYPKMDILCYTATALNKQFGFLYNKLSKQNLSKIGVIVLPQCKEMVL